jgi:hypothetical protein
VYTTAAGVGVVLATISFLFFPSTPRNGCPPRPAGYGSRYAQTMEPERLA